MLLSFGLTVSVLLGLVLGLVLRATGAALSEAIGTGFLGGGAALAAWIGWIGVLAILRTADGAS